MIAEASRIKRDRKRLPISIAEIGAYRAKLAAAIAAGEEVHGMPVDPASLVIIDIALGRMMGGPDAVIRKYKLPARDHRNVGRLLRKSQRSALEIAEDLVRYEFGRNG